MRFFLFGAFLLLLLQCQNQLQHPEKSPDQPISGHWIANTDDPGHVFVLYIFEDHTGQSAWRFQFIELFFRNLVLSGPRIYINQREGIIQTSASELLLIQQKFKGGYYPMESKNVESWEPQNLLPVVLDRDFEKVQQVALLTIDPDGRELQNDDYLFRRTGAALLNKQDLANEQTGIILGLNKSANQLYIYSFAPSFALQDARRITWLNDRQKVSLDLIQNRYNFSMADMPPNTAQFWEQGQLLFLNNFQPGKNLNRQLTRQEVLERIRKGLPVPREDLIRVLGTDRP
ncbi:MAG: hypothetical protein KDK39_02775 [Leptospiraceae bacterium]|nr:hypothetical protein [Leptospiraceae bacterium]